MPLGWDICTYSWSHICKPNHLSLLNTEWTSKYAVQTTRSVKQVWLAVGPCDIFTDLSSFHSPAPVPCNWSGVSLWEKQQGEGRSLSNSAADTRCPLQTWLCSPALLQTPAQDQECPLHMQKLAIPEWWVIHLSCLWWLIRLHVLARASPARS